MAALVETHVQSTADDVAPVCGDNKDQSDPQVERGDEDSGNEEEGGDEESGNEGESGNEESGNEGESDQDGDGGSEGEGAGAEGEDEGNANAGWAEAMAKILGKKTSESKSSILVKNKELEKVKKKEKQEQLERKKQDDKKRAWEMLCREKPDIVKDREAERALQRIATRGVVQLFNAVKKHQKTMDDKVKEVGGSERKRAKLLSSVSKKDFIDVLRGAEGGKGASSKTQEKPAAVVDEDEKPAWSVLRDDFMMGASMKDWDKDSDKEEEEDTGKGAGAEDSDSD